MKTRLPCFFLGGGHGVDSSTRR